MKVLKTLWGYRYFIVSSIKTELYARLVRSRLGIVWIVIHPLAQVAIYAFVLSTVLSSKLPGIHTPFAYAIYLMSGMLAWTLFAELMNKSLNLFIDNANILKKMAFPKLALPCIVAGSALVSNGILFLAILGVFGLLGHFPSQTVIWLPLLLFLNLLLAASVGLILAILHVFMRDIGQFVPMMMQLWFWLTPIVYTANIIPERFHFLISLNPMHAIVVGYQAILAYRTVPDLSTLIYPSILTACTMLLALWLYAKADEEMVDVL